MTGNPAVAAVFMTGFETVVAVQNGADLGDILKSAVIQFAISMAIQGIQESGIFTDSASVSANEAASLDEIASQSGAMNIRGQTALDLDGDPFSGTIFSSKVPGGGGGLARSVHKNSKASTSSQHCYIIFCRSTGRVAKTGVSSAGETAAGLRKRAQSQLGKMAKIMHGPNATKDMMQSWIIRRVPAGQGARSLILQVEKRVADHLRSLRKGHLPIDTHKRP